MQGKVLYHAKSQKTTKKKLWDFVYDAKNRIRFYNRLKFFHRLGKLVQYANGIYIEDEFKVWLIGNETLLKVSHQKSTILIQF